MPERRPAFLFIGGSYHQVSAIQSLRELGLFVAVTDRNEEAPAAAACDRFSPIGATDVAAMLVLAKKLEKEFRLVGVYGMADYAFKSAYAVASACRLAGPDCESPGLLTDKALTSERLSSMSLPVPELLWSGDRGELPSEIASSKIEGKNVVVKPRSLNSSTGTQILKSCSAHQLRDMPEGSFTAGESLMIESYCEGRVGNVDGLMIDGHYFPISTSLRHHNPDAPAISMATIQPAGLPDHDARAHQLAQRAALALGYRTGPVTVDLVIGEDGKLDILEVSPHFHNIWCEIARGNGNPMAAYGAWLMGHEDWQSHLPQGEARHGVCYHRNMSGQPDTTTKENKLKALARLPGVFEARLVRKDRVHSGAIAENDTLCQVWATAETQDVLDRTIEWIEREVSAHD